MVRLAAVSVDLDEIPNYFAIHGLPPPQGDAAHAVYDVALSRLDALARAHELPLTLFAIGADTARKQNAAALRAMEILADALLKATKVEGIYDRDPNRHAGATMLESVSYDRFLADHLGVMDSTAVALCRENGLPIRVFRMVKGNIKRVCLGEEVGTSVTDAGFVDVRTWQDFGGHQRVVGGRVPA